MITRKGVRVAVGGRTADLPPGLPMGCRVRLAGWPDREHHRHPRRPRLLAGGIRRRGVRIWVCSVPRFGAQRPGRRTCGANAAHQAGVRIGRVDRLPRLLGVRLGRVDTRAYLWHQR